MSQAKEDVAVAYITYLVNQWRTESISSNPQPQKKSRVKLVLLSLIIGIAVEIESLKKLTYCFN